MQKTSLKSMIIPTIGLSLLGLSLTAQAAVIQATANWSIGGGIDKRDIEGPASTGTVDILDSDGNAGDSVFYHTYGNTTGTFGSRVSGEGTFDISSLFSFTETYQNTTATAQDASFSFSLIPGELDVNFYGIDMGDSDFLTAGYAIDVRISGSSITNGWSSSYSIEQNSGGLFNSSTGEDIGGTYDSANGRYTWGRFDETLGLGSIAAGESFTIEYDLRTMASGDLSDSTCLNSTPVQETNVPIIRFQDGVFDGIDAPIVVDGVGGGSNVICGDAIARSGDPLTPQFGNTTTVNMATSVPEPATLLLLGLGLAGMSFNRKRHQS